MSIRYVSGGIKYLGPSEAVELLRAVDDAWQRDFMAPHAQHLAMLMAKDEFLATGSVVTAHMRSGEKRSANGRHTLYAIKTTGREQRCLVEVFHCDTDEDYVRLFHSYDTENRKRSFPDSAKAFQMVRKETLPEVSVTTLNLFRCGTELAMQMRGESLRHKTRYERFDVVTHLVEELEFYLWLDGQKDCREVLGRASIMAAVVNTYHANKAAARDFWRQVVSNFYDCARENTYYAPRTLNRYLRNAIQTGTETGARKLGTSLAEIVTRKSMYVGCLRAWNAYMDGRALNFIRVKIGKAMPQPATKHSASHALEMVG